jgi:hypothetical protein
MIAIFHNESMSTRHRIEDRNLLLALLTGESDFRGPAAILEGLTPEQAFAKPHNLPHSIAEILAHITFWQEWFNSCARNGFTGLVEHAEPGWPSVDPDTWDTIRGGCLEAIEESKRIAAQLDHLDEPALPSGVKVPTLANDSRGSLILRALIHRDHHLGQIVTIRQILGAWPPPSGSMTW